ncbi:MAG: hypothetical protein HYU63_03465 [Armatimonadetes bacterium]|nr:hypothetical protein [Armatimonadota bacterium]
MSIEKTGQVGPSKDILAQAISQPKAKKINKDSASDKTEGAKKVLFESQYTTPFGKAMQSMREAMGEIQKSPEFAEILKDKNFQAKTTALAEEYKKAIESNPELLAKLEHEIPSHEIAGKASCLSYAYKDEEKTDWLVFLTIIYYTLIKPK